METILHLAHETAPTLTDKVEWVLRWPGAGGFLKTALAEVLTQRRDPQTLSFDEWVGEAMRLWRKSRRDW